MASPFKAISDQANQRLADARAQKDGVAQDIREAYFFTNPRLYRQVRSDSPPTTKVDDETQVVTGVGTEANEDFATEVLTAFFPPAIPWVQSMPTANVKKADKAKMVAAAKAVDDQVFDEIRSSNLDAELGTALTPDIGVGTIGLWVDEDSGHLPIRVQHVPIRELEINVGPRGDVDDRFAVKYIRYRSLRAMIPNVEIPAHFAKKIEKKPNEYVRVAWGFWRDWNVRGDEVWTAVIMLDGEVVWHGDRKGEGSVELLVARFAPDNLHAFGNGPSIKALPDLRVLDALTEAQQNRGLTSMNPPFAFPDDGIMNFEGGIRDGMAYPKRPGGGPNDIVPLYFAGDVNLGFFTTEDLRRSIRRKHFADYPEQAGKTPPTATQWADEMAKSQRRLGTPGAKFFNEGPVQIFNRFRFLGQRRKTVQPYEYEGKPLVCRPSNPAAKALEQQEVAMATRLLEILNAFFPQFMATVVDPVKTATALKEKLGDKIITFRSEEEAAALIQKTLEAAPGVQQQLAPPAAGGGAPQ